MKKKGEVIKSPSIDVKKTIVLVEDEDTIRMLIKFRLTNAGFYVVDFNDAIKMVEYFDSGKTCELVVLDLILPLMTGTEALLYLKENYKKIPVLILSARTLEKDIVRHLQYGACDYMTKPFRPNELVARVNNLLRRCE